MWKEFSNHQGCRAWTGDASLSFSMYMKEMLDYWYNSYVEVFMMPFF
jgi:hypothetical protein